MRKVVFAALLAALLLPASAHATFPGANGKIAFERSGDIWTMNADGSGQVNLTNTSAPEHDPNWSPDGSKIVFKDGTRGFLVMNADGSGVTDLGNGPTPDFWPAWSPDGTKIAFSAQTLTIVAMMADDPNDRWVVGHAGAGSDSTNERPDWSPDGERIAWTVWCDGDFGDGQTSYIAMAPAEGGGPVERVTSAEECHPNSTYELPYGDANPSWSPDAQRILFERQRFSGADPSGTYSIKPDGTGKTFITSGFSLNAVWSPDGSRIAYENGPGTIGVMNADGTGRTDIATGSVPDWQPIPINAYARPKGATPFRVSLVPANAQCTAPNRTHGAPLAFGSCSPPALTSQYLTTGTPDANGRAARMNAYLLLKTIVGNSSTPADEADVAITAHLNDVANKNLSDYTGAVRAILPLRITDKDNTPSPGGPGAATTEPFQYGFDVPCTPDPAPGIGSDCSITTTADTLVPGTIKESKRTVWQVGRARVDDGGADGDPSTTADNTVFAVQGVFIP